MLNPGFFEEFYRLLSRRLSPDLITVDLLNVNLLTAERTANHITLLLILLSLFLNWLLDLEFVFLCNGYLQIGQSILGRDFLNISLWNHCILGKFVLFLLYFNRSRFKTFI